MNKEEMMKSNLEEINRILKDEEFMVQYASVKKNNVTKDAYRLIPKNGEVGFYSPVAYYDLIEDCISSPEDVAMKLSEIWNCEMTQNFPDAKELASKEYILNNVFPRVVSNSNTELIDYQNLVFKEFLDMYVIYYVNVEELSDGTATYNLSKDMIEKIGLDTEELHTQAIKNLEKEVTIRDMQEVIMSIMGMCEAEELDFSQVPETIPMLVLSKKDNIFGAAAMLCPGVIEKLSSYWKDDFVILPSSIHECISVKMADNTEQELKEMVMEINETQVSPEDRLTDSVYVYRNGEFHTF